MYIVCTDQVSKQEDEAAALGARLQAQSSELQAMEQDTALREEMTQLLQHANTDIVRPPAGRKCMHLVRLTPRSLPQINLQMSRTRGRRGALYTGWSASVSG